MNTTPVRSNVVETTPEMNEGGRENRKPEIVKVGVTVPEMNVGGRAKGVTPVTGPATAPDMKVGALVNRTPARV